MERVQTLKGELTAWRGKLDDQMKTYRSELGDLRTQLNSEVEDLREQFSDLQSTIHSQLETTAALSDTEGSHAAKEAAASKLGRVA